MLSISNWAAQELVKLLPQAEGIIPRTANVREANIRRRLIKMAKYINNAERKKQQQKGMGKTAQASS